MNKIIIKKTTVLECWCTKCGKGQMEHILDDSFETKKGINDWIDMEIVCPQCKTKHIINDVVELMPTVFNVISHKDVKNYKRDESVKNHLEKE